MKKTSAYYSAVSVVLSSLQTNDPLGYQMEEFAKIWPPYGARIKGLQELADRKILIYRRKAGARSHWILGPQASSFLMGETLLPA